MFWLVTNIAVTSREKVVAGAKRIVKQKNPDPWRKFSEGPCNVRRHAKRGSASIVRAPRRSHVVSKRIQLWRQDILNETPEGVEAGRRFRPNLDE